MASTSNHSKRIKVEPNASSDEQHTPSEGDMNIENLIEGYVKREFSVKTETECDPNNVGENHDERFNKTKIEVSEPFENLWDSLLSQIESNENKAKRLQCNDCDYTAKYRQNLAEHKKIHVTQRLLGMQPGPIDRIYACTDCDLQFTKWYAFKNHRTKSHQNNRLAIHCIHCLRRFQKELKKDRHESRCQSPRFECYLCKEYECYNKLNMREHMRIHSGTRPLECHVCNMNFRQLSSLTKHLFRAHKYAHVQNND